MNIDKAEQIPVISNLQYTCYRSHVYSLMFDCRVLVLNKMEEMYQASSFHDSAELNQATQFLHENGVLLHYDDINLQNVYFLDPQWLCDVLANVVTIREINSLAKCGKNLVYESLKPEVHYVSEYLFMFMFMFMFGIFQV